MKDYIELFLDKKFPLKIEISEKRHPNLKGLTMFLYKSGNKRLFIKMSGFTGVFYNYYDLTPEQLTMWFELSYSEAEKKLIKWTEKRIKKQSS